MASLFTTTTDDQRFALTVLQLLTRATEPQPSVYLVHDGAPVVKGRPRFTKKGPTFTPKRTVKAEKDLAWAASTARPVLAPDSSWWACRPEEFAARFAEQLPRLLAVDTKVREPNRDSFEANL
jgi:hypothetical protein